MRRQDSEVERDRPGRMVGDGGCSKAGGADGKTPSNSQVCVKVREVLR